mmetsp:Transcript_50264/g.162738  ORF Transcript_50264/g.162738 Transcript_50264/m.162738 type:complete len:402 (-) Transcript_50264:820-2025(-)
MSGMPCLCSGRGSGCKSKISSGLALSNSGAGPQLLAPRLGLAQRRAVLNELLLGVDLALEVFGVHPALLPIVLHHEPLHGAPDAALPHLGGQCEVRHERSGVGFPNHATALFHVLFRHRPRFVHEGSIHRPELGHPPLDVLAGRVVGHLRAQLHLDVLAVGLDNVLDLVVRVPIAAPWLLHGGYGDPIPVIHRTIVVEKQLLEEVGADAPICPQAEDQEERRGLPPLVGQPAGLPELTHARIDVRDASLALLPSLHLWTSPDPRPLDPARALQPEEAAAESDRAQAMPLAPHQPVHHAVEVRAGEGPGVDLARGDAAHREVLRHAEPPVRPGEVRPLQRIVTLPRTVPHRQVPEHGVAVLRIAAVAVLLAQPDLKRAPGIRLPSLRILPSKRVCDLLRRVA